MTKVIHYPERTAVVIYIQDQVRICSTEGLREYTTKHNIPLRTYKDLKQLLLKHPALPKYVEYHPEPQEPKQLKIKAMN